MSARKAGRAVVLADIVASRDVRGFRLKRDKRLKEVSEKHIGLGWVEARYAVTAWDEFQNLLGRVADAPNTIFGLRCAFHPLGLRIAVGVGRISSHPRPGEPINVAVTGEAFERARRGMDDLKSGGSRKYRRLTTFCSGDEELDRTVNLVYGLQDTLLQKITNRQWQTILAVERAGQQDTAADELEVDESTVSRNLQRGFYWQLRDTSDTLTRILEKWCP